MRSARALVWLACVGACAGHLTKPSPRAAKQDRFDAHLGTARDRRDVSSGKVTELSHKGGESTGGHAIDALGHGDPAEDAPQTITSEAAAFDHKGLSGSTARNAAAEMVKSRLATQTTRPVFEQRQRRLECVDDFSTTGQYDVDCWYYYDSPSDCGEYNDEDFTASDRCCACGGGLSPSPTISPAPTATFAPTASPLVADNASIRAAVRLWLKDRAAAEATYGHISTWETGGVTDMSELFEDASSFNEDICAWDTSGVTTMYSMFDGASSFNQPLGDWRVDKVTDTSYMFRSDSAFNQPIGDWRVDKVTRMDSMFRDASSFNQPLNDWRVHKVRSMDGMFDGASSFNQPLNDWRVDNVTDMDYMFRSAKSFNQPLNDWRVDKVTRMYSMFESAKKFNQDLGWCVDDDARLGYRAGAFSGTQCGVGNCGVVQDENDCYVLEDGSIRTAVWRWLRNATAAEATHGHISTWETGRVTDMSYLFCGSQYSSDCNSAAASFNEDIGAWDTSGVTEMSHVFDGASAFNQDVGDWALDNLMRMDGMFQDASKFNQVLGWCVSKKVNVEDAFGGTKCADLSCGVVQGICPDPDAAAGEYCKLSDPEFCSGSRYSFVEAQSNPFANVESRYAVPTLADVDGDGKDDLLVGQEDGTLALYRHVESEFQHVVGDEDPFKSVAVGGHAAPVLVDLDGDDDLDLVLGAADGKLVYFRNEGSMTFRRVTATEAPTRAPTRSPTPGRPDVLRLRGGSTEREGRVEIFHEGRWGTVCEDRWDIADANVVCQELFGTVALEFKGGAFFGEGTGPIWMDEVFCVGDEAALWLCPFYGDIYDDEGDRRRLKSAWGSHDCAHSEDAGVVCDGARRLLDQDQDQDPFASINVGAHSAPAFTDIDGDGLADLVIGKETSGALTYYKNVGLPTTAKFQAVRDDPFENVVVARFSKPMFYDFDNDGDQDLIVGDGVGDLVLYLNVGSRFVPEFSIVEDSLASISAHAAPTFSMLNGVPSLVVGSGRGQLVVYGDTLKVSFVTPKNGALDGIEIGGKPHTIPHFVDLDGDGDLDLVVGRYSDTIYWRNVGTPSRPNFERVLPDVSPFQGLDGKHQAPTFADLDNDGDQDLVVGDADGTLRYYRNVGNSSQPTFEKIDEESPFDSIDGRFIRQSTPAFADLDGDGLLDLVVGEDDGTLNYYRNVGTPSQPIFEKVGCVNVVPTTTDSRGNDCSWYKSNKWSCGDYNLYNDEDFTASEQCCECGGGVRSPFDGIGVGETPPYYDSSTPSFVDLDGDGDQDLVVGDLYGRLFYWRNVGTPSQPKFEKVGENPFDGIDVGDSSAPTFVDLDNDGDLDLVVGDEAGRLSYFQNTESCRKTGEDGACSGHGVCGALNGTRATCECLFTFEGVQCDTCRAGYNGTDCETCPGNTWSKAGVGETCDQCEIGYYRDGDTCDFCGEDKVCETTDVTIDNFECIAGTYRDGNECKSCENGMKCETVGVTLQNVRLEHNKWRTSENSDVIEDCPLTESCRSPNETQARRRLDDSGNSTEEEYDAGENLCAPGYHGPLCAVCKSHHYRSGNECKKCSRGSAALNISLFCIVFVGFVVAVVLSLIYSENKVEKAHLVKKKSTETRKDIEETRSTLQTATQKVAAAWGPLRKALKPGPMRRTLGTAIKQMLGMWSVVSSTPWILDVSYPKVFDKTLAFFNNVFSFDFTIAADCAASHIGFKDQLLMDTLGPFVLCALVALVALVVAKWSRKSNGAQNRTTLYASNLILFIIFLSYTTASTMIFRSLRPCHEFDEAYHGSNKYMKDDYGTSCHSKRHRFIQIYALIMLFVYPVGVPLLTFVFLWRHRKTLNPVVDIGREFRGLEKSYVDKKQKEPKSVGSCTELSLQRSCLALRGKSSDAHAPLDDVQKNITKAKMGERDRRIDEMKKYDDLVADGGDEFYSHFYGPVDESRLTELKQRGVLLRRRSLIDQPELFAFMYENYEPEYWWFECFDYIRRLMLTGILVVLSEGSAAQGLFGVLVALFGTQVYGWTRPFPEDTGDRLAETAQWSTFFTFLAALLILLDVEADSSFHREVFAVLLVAIQFMPLVIGAAVSVVNGKGLALNRNYSEVTDENGPNSLLDCLTCGGGGRLFQLSRGLGDALGKVGGAVANAVGGVASAAQSVATNIFSRSAAPGDEVKAENEGSPTSPLSRGAPPYDEEHPGPPPESH